MANYRVQFRWIHFRSNSQKSVVIQLEINGNDKKMKGM